MIVLMTPLLPYAKLSTSLITSQLIMSSTKPRWLTQET